MSKYKFIVRKTQDSIVEIEVDSSQTLGDVTEKIELMSDEELNFDDPQYHLVAISKEDEKLSRIIWRDYSF